MTTVLCLLFFSANGIAFAQQSSVVPLFSKATKLEPAISLETKEALVTRIGDRVRDRHARESQFQAYDHYLSFYWEQRTIGLEIVDKIAKGGDEIVINIESLAPLNEPNFRSFFRGQNTVAEYHLNQIAAPIGKNKYSLAIKLHPVENRRLKLGDKVEFEFSPFLAAPRNGRSNYYGTTMLYVVGKGVVPWMGVGDRLDSFPIPISARLGGGTTVSYPHSDEPEERFKQMAGNISPHSAQSFVMGRRLHHTNMLDGTHSEQPNPVFERQKNKLGPHFVSESCVACHKNNGRALPPDAGVPMYQSVIKVASDAKGNPHLRLGASLQPRSLEGKSEATATLAEYELTKGTYADGEAFELRKPVYRFGGVQADFYSVRLTPQLVGLGLLEAIRERDVLAMADPEDKDRDGISGRPQIVLDPETNQKRLGRFGYKAAQARIRHQVAAALNNDMGVTTSVYKSLDENPGPGEVEVSGEDLNELVRYIALLGVNAQRNFASEDVKRGRVLFEKAACVSCHRPSFTTSSYHPFAELRDQEIQPYTDLLLHDMGDGLADSLGEQKANGAEWRTTPLWGIGLTKQVSGGESYLHDGRARTLAEAILWHGGEGEQSREAFRNMSRKDRVSLIKFLESL